MDPPEPSPDNDYLAHHIQLLRNRYRQLLHRDLVDPNLGAKAAAKALYTADFVLVSHDTSADPVFNYGNLTALRLFEMSWADFTSLPSRQSAEPPNQQERSQLLRLVSTQGFIENYAGIRISKTGKKFWIKDVTVWNLIDATGKYRGQAAVYSHWESL